MRCPARARSPTRSEDATGSYVLRRPPGWRTTTTPRPATGPAWSTTPRPTATTGCPSRPARSTPRWPGPQRVEGRSKPRTTRGRGDNGHTHFRSPASGSGSENRLDGRSSTAPGSESVAVGAPTDGASAVGVERAGGQRVDRSDQGRIGEATGAPDGGIAGHNTGVITSRAAKAAERIAPRCTGLARLHATDARL